MAQVKVFYESELELLTVFWQALRDNQVCTELGDGVILIKDSHSGEPIGLELLSYRPGDSRFDTVIVEVGQPSGVKSIPILGNIALYLKLSMVFSNLQPSSVHTPLSGRSQGSTGSCGR